MPKTSDRQLLALALAGLAIALALAAWDFTRPGTRYKVSSPDRSATGTNPETPDEAGSLK